MNEPAPSHGLLEPKCQPILERFDEAWREAIRRFEPPPDIAAFLPPDERSPLRAKALAPLAEIDLQKRVPYRRLLSFLGKPIPDDWRGDDDKEDLLRRFPELADSRKALRMLMIADRQARLTFERCFEGNRNALSPYDPPAPSSPFAGAWDDAIEKKLGGLRPPRGRYKVFWKIDEGGFGEVFWVYDRHLRRWDVAKKIKTLDRADHRRRRRLIREARIAGRLDHPGIAPVHAIARDAAGHPYYVMRYAAGETLRDRIERAFAQWTAGSLTLDQFLWERRVLLRHLVDVCHVVQYAHSRKVVHRDLKPSNIRIRDHATIVVDWGLAKEDLLAADDSVIKNAVANPNSDADPSAIANANASSTAVPNADSSLTPKDWPPASPAPSTVPDSPDGDGVANWTQTQGMIGTLIYMSPEQARGESKRAQPASDIYSLGSTLYHLLTGSAPFDGSFEEVRDRVIRGDFKRPRKICAVVTKPLEAICLKAMALQPSDRYASPRELAQDLERGLAGLPVSAYPEPLFDRVARWLWKHRDWAPPIAIAASLLVLVGLAAAQRVVQARIEARVANLETIPPQDAPPVIESLREDVGYATRLLEIRWEAIRLRTKPEDLIRRQIAFALESLRGDGALGADLAEMILEAPFGEVLTLRDVAAQHPGRAAPRLWQALEDPQETPRRRLQAGCALAAFPEVGIRDPNADSAASDDANAKTEECRDRWRRHSELIVSESVAVLVTTPAYYPQIRRMLAPVGPLLLDRLRLVLEDPKQGEGAKLIAGNLLADFCGDATDIAAEALMEDIPPPVRDRLWDLLGTDQDKAIARLDRETAGIDIGWLNGVDKLEQRANRKAKAALMLARLGRPEPFRRLLPMTPDPTTRSRMIDHAKGLGLEAEFLLRTLTQETDPSARQALLLMLGDWEPSALPQSELRGLETQLRKWFAADPDPGLHSTIQWLWRRWDQRGQEQSSLAELAQGPPPPLASLLAANRRGWMVSPSGLTLVAIPPTTYTRGSWNLEQAVSHETRHRIQIPRGFAIAAFETDGQIFARFLRSHPNADAIQRDCLGLGRPSPILGIDWYRAAEFCRWLSELEGFPDAECCYPSVETIEACRQSGAALTLPANFLERTGYRLPTEAEWECACRAGSDSPRFFGWSISGLSSYARYSDNPNPEDHPLPTGSLRPNPWGLFDILGNAGEWVQDSFVPYPGFTLLQSKSDASQEFRVTVLEAKIVRGGSYGRTAPYLRSGARQASAILTSHRDTGFRIARTVPFAKQENKELKAE